MAWSTFKSTMLPIMVNHRFGRSFEQWATAFTDAYDLAIKTGRTTVTNVPLMVGNKSAMRSQLVSILSKTQKRKVGSLLDVIGPAIISYWTGASLMNLPPIIPCPGAIVNISATSAPVLSPGVWTPVAVPPNNNPIIFLNAFCTAATIHLTTVSGLHNCICNYPGTPVIVSPGVLPWVGYTAG